MLTRRQLLQRGALGAGALAIPSSLLRGATAAAARPFTTVPPFTVRLPIPLKATAVAPNTYHITQRQTQQVLHPKLGGTTVWAYDDGTLGPLLTDLAAAITPLLRVGGGPRASVVGELLADPQGIDHLVEALDESDHGEADGRPG